MHVEHAFGSQEESLHPVSPWRIAIRMHISLLTFASGRFIVESSDTGLVQGEHQSSFIGMTSVAAVEPCSQTPVGNAVHHAACQADGTSQSVGAVDLSEDYVDQLELHCQQKVNHSCLAVSYKVMRLKRPTTRKSDSTFCTHKHLCEVARKMAPHPLHNAPPPIRTPL